MNVSKKNLDDGTSYADRDLHGRRSRKNIWISVAVMGSLLSLFLCWSWWRDHSYWVESRGMWELYFVVGPVLAISVFYTFLGNQRMFEHEEIEKAEIAALAAANKVGDQPDEDAKLIARRKFPSQMDTEGRPLLPQVAGLTFPRVILMTGATIAAVVTAPADEGTDQTLADTVENILAAPTIGWRRLFTGREAGLWLLSMWFFGAIITLCTLSFNLPHVQSGSPIFPDLLSAIDYPGLFVMTLFSVWQFLASLNVRRVGSVSLQGTVESAE